MSDIFISYARSTEREARAIAEALRALGFAVWRDDELPAHRDYSDVIEERLKASKAVLVVWSAEAAKSQWVRAEADVAREAGKLVQLNLDSTALPMPFNRIQCADLTGWSGDDGHPGWRKVVDSISELCGKSAEPGAAVRSTAMRGKSICVLPFVNMSGDPEQEYFSDGISEDIITDLSKVSALNVASRNSAFTFKGKTLEIPDIARKLGVSHVVEGSVRKAGNRVRITAQLIEAATDTHLWAERYDRDLTDIFALQDEISQAIVAALMVKLLPEEKKAIETRGTDNVQAYNLYLMARKYSGGQSAKRGELVIRLCQNAIDLDPGYARAWSLMAFAKSSQAESLSAGALAGAGLEEAERALALDPNLAGAHAAKASILLRTGDIPEARIALETALALDPEAPDVNTAAGNLAIKDRRFADAIRHFEAATTANEYDGGSPFMALQCYEALGDMDGAKAAARLAIERLEKAVAEEPDNGSILGFGVGALAVLGEVDRARDWAAHALVISPGDSRLRYNLGCGMIRLGEIDYALELLQTSFELSKGGLVAWARDDSDFDRIRDDPRFKAVMEKGEAILAAAQDAEAVARLAKASD